MTVSKKIRAYLAKVSVLPKADELAVKFNCSRPMAYKLLKEHREGAAALATSLSAIKEMVKPAIDPQVVERGKTLVDMVKQEMAALEQDDKVNHPPHYKAGGIETIDFIEAKGLQHNYYLANAIKYISRAPFKGTYKTDLEKAVWYLNRELQGIPDRAAASA